MLIVCTIAVYRLDEWMSRREKGWISANQTNQFGYIFIENGMGNLTGLNMYKLKIIDNIS